MSEQNNNAYLEADSISDAEVEDDVIINLSQKHRLLALLKDNGEMSKEKKDLLADMSKFAIANKRLLVEESSAQSDAELAIALDKLESKLSEGAFTRDNLGTDAPSNFEEPDDLGYQFDEEELKEDTSALTMESIQGEQ